MEFGGFASLSPMTSSPIASFSQASDSSNSPVLQRPELLAPAGQWDCAKAAVENGADAIYFGLDRFNARMRAENFTEADLPELMAYMHQHGVKGYVTLNTLVFPKELTEAEQYLRTMIAAGVDAVIVQDVGICRLIRHLSPDFPIHASTQMTITSAAGVEFAQYLGCQLVVLARECSLKEINKIQAQLEAQQIALPLEVFVHGALCVAYSGQCLTSEALGGRSANRGECAQACRMQYDLIADGQQVDLRDRSYLLSPQDLSGLPVLADLVKSGVTSLKIEGRLKSPEYVANVTRTYRQALDRVMTQGQTLATPATDPTQPEDRYNLEMAFSRGLYTGWFEGIDNQALVHARFGKKRGVYLGEVTQIHAGRYPTVTINLQAPIKPGDGVVFDNGHPEAREEGGRVYTVEHKHQGKTETATLTFGDGAINLKRIQDGNKLWKTSDPELDRELQQTFAENASPFQREIEIAIDGAVGKVLSAIARDAQGHIAQVDSAMPLVEAHTKPLTTNRLVSQFGRLGNTPFKLGSLDNRLTDNVMLPVSELNRMRRELVIQLEEQRSQPKPWTLQAQVSYRDLLPAVASPDSSVTPELIVLVRNRAQLEAACDRKIQTLYCEFENPAAYREAVRWFRQQQSDQQTIWVAPPRITKPLETYILQQVQRSEADGYLVRNYDQLQWFQHERQIGDFSLNVANPITADYFKSTYSLERLTASYDLNVAQLSDLLATVPSDWLEITIHQHMPMFHMEHCVFCAFLSEGTDYTNCGRPCESQEVKLRDRVGTEHILQADAGCRNTIFNGTAQTAAEYVQHLIQQGGRHFRLEFLRESPDQVAETIGRYQQLLRGEIDGRQLWRDLRLTSQLGVTRGTLQNES